MYEVKENQKIKSLHGKRIKWEIYSNQYKLEVIECKNRQQQQKDNRKIIGWQAIRQKNQLRVY